MRCGTTISGRLGVESKTVNGVKDLVTKTRSWQRQFTVVLTCCQTYVVKCFCGLLLVIDAGFRLEIDC